MVNDTAARPGRKTGRRAILGVAAASMAAAAVTKLGSNGVAEAAGSPMNYGTDNASSGAPETNRTALFSSNATDAVLLTNGSTGPGAVALNAVVGSQTAPTHASQSAGILGATTIDSADSAGVVGQATAAANGVGVMGVATGTSGIGVRSNATGASSKAFEVENSVADGQVGLEIASVTTGKGVDVWILDDDGTGVSVTSTGTGTGVDVNVPTGIGVKGTVNSQTKYGIFGVNNIGPAVQGDTVSGQGIVGRVTGTGVGVCALDDGGNHGTALVVLGKSSFSGNATFTGSAALNGDVSANKYSGKDGAAPKFNTTGIATIGKGKTSVKVTNAKASTSSKVLVTCQSDPGTAAIKYVKKAAGSFEIILTAKAAASLKVAWFIIG